MMAGPLQIAGAPAPVNGLIALALEAFRQRHFAVARRWLDAAFAAPLAAPISNPGLLWLYCICAAESHDPQAATAAFAEGDRLFADAVGKGLQGLTQLRDLARKWSLGGVHASVESSAHPEGSLGWTAR